MGRTNSRSVSWGSERRALWLAVGLAGLVSAGVGAQHLGIPGAAEPEFLPLAVAAGEPSVAPVPPPAAPAPPGAFPPLPPPVVKASSAIVVDAQTGQVIWERNAHVRRPVASTTKIVTATLLIESNRLDETVTFSNHARATPYANLHAKPGERFRLRDLLYAIMLRSSNDSCVAAAEHLSGQAWRFAAQMTQRARDLGARNTHFVTTNGLYHPNHLSTAADLAVLTRHAMQYGLFNEVVSTQERVISRTINQKDTLIRNHNKFLERYEGADGVKTGYVRQSGRCLVASATRADQGQPWRLITVVLNSDDTYGDSERLQNWTRKYFQPVFLATQGRPAGALAVRGGSRRSVPVLAAADLRPVLPRSEVARLQVALAPAGELRAPVDVTGSVGSLRATVDGRVVAEVPVRAATPVAESWLAAHSGPWTGLPVLAGLLLLPRLPRLARALGRRALRRRSRRRAAP